jgi:hypothetical protein
MNAWSNFFTAIVSAAAALAGLIFVGVSFSLTRILSIAKLPDRALESLILLVTVLVISALCLVPDQSAQVMGIEVLVIGFLSWVITLKLDLGILRKTEVKYKRYYVLNIVFTQLAELPYIVAGIMILTHGFPGIYWLIPGIICSLVKSLADAWVLLVEIHR